jgi:hypothetical protein
MKRFLDRNVDTAGNGAPIGVSTLASGGISMSPVPAAVSSAGQSGSQYGSRPALASGVRALDDPSL